MAITYALFVFFLALLILGIVMIEVKLNQMERDVEHIKRQVDFLMKQEVKAKSTLKF